MAGDHVVVVQQSAEGGCALDLVRRRGFVGIFVSHRDLVAESLMRTVTVMMAFDGFQCVLQMPKLVLQRYDEMWYYLSVLGFSLDEVSAECET